MLRGKSNTLHTAALPASLPPLCHTIHRPGFGYSNDGGGEVVVGGAVGGGVCVEVMEEVVEEIHLFIFCIFEKI